MSRFERVVMFPFQFFGNTFSVLIPFAIWLGLLDSVLIPFSERYLSQALFNLGLEQDDVVNGSHAFAFAIGLMMMFAGNARTLMKDVKCCPENKVLEEEVVFSPSETFDIANLLHIFQATTMTLLLSSTLLGSALFKGEVAIGTIFQTFWRPVLLAIFFGISGYIVSRIKLSEIVDFMIDPEYPRRRTFFTYTLLIILWNVHLFPFFGCWLPFHVLSYVVQSPEYNQLDAFLDGTLYVFSGPYGSLVIVQGMIKLMSTRLKLHWGYFQESLLAVVVLSGPTVTMWIRWHQGHIALPVHFAMGCIQILYILTFRNRPEYSGWRDWPELKETRLWILIQDYFSVRMIVDGVVDVNESKVLEGRNHVLKGFEPSVPRIFGFHPHGMFPCTVVWMHLIPLWGKVFGKLIPYQLTDAFTHVPPGMREVMQWSGGREITKGVMNAMLKHGNSLIIVPGGQRELLMHSYENTQEKKMVLDAKHRGFIRVAMENRAQLVPVLNFGELTAIKNLPLPRLHRFTRRTIGIPATFLPVGVGGFLPIPNCTPMTLVFGKPITYFQDNQKPSFTEDDVEVVYRMYFNEVRRLFKEYQNVAGYGDWQLILSDFDETD